MPRTKRGISLLDDDGPSEHNRKSRAASGDAEKRDIMSEARNKYETWRQTCS